MTKESVYVIVEWQVSNVINVKMVILDTRPQDAGIRESQFLEK